MYQINLEFGPVERLSRNKQPLYEIGWYDEYAFDFRYPFREIIDHIVHELKREHSQVELKIDAYWENEDFIYFSLKVDDNVFSGYFEHSLCTLSFTHGKKGVLAKFRNTANRVLFYSEGYAEGRQL